MPQQLLHGADVVTVSQNMRGEGMSKGDRLVALTIDQPRIERKSKMRIAA